MNHYGLGVCIMALPSESELTHYAVPKRLQESYNALIDDTNNTTDGYDKLAKSDSIKWKYGWRDP